MKTLQERKELIAKIRSEIEPVSGKSTFKNIDFFGYKLAVPSDEDYFVQLCVSCDGEVSLHKDDPWTRYYDMGLFYWNSNSMIELAELEAPQDVLIYLGENSPFYINDFEEWKEDKLDSES